MPCLDENALLRLFESGDDGTRAPLSAVVEQHLDTCRPCRSMVAAYARASRDRTTTPFGSTVLASPAPAESAPGPTPGAWIDDRYRLVSVVGEGGMGVVWSAVDTWWDERVAIKFLRVTSPELVTRFAREARLASAIRHPNVLETRAFVTAFGGPAIVTDLLEGEPLSALLARRSPLTPPETVSLMLPLLSAVRAAHAASVLHRDLKPQNVFLAREAEGREPVVTLLDFGLAKLVGDDDDFEKLTRSGAIVGTPAFMAPEQLLGEAVDAKADVWSLGAVACACLTGKPPYPGKNLAQLVRNAMRGPPEAIGAKCADVPSALATLIDAMLAVDRRCRPTVPEVHAALDALARS